MAVSELCPQAFIFLCFSLTQVTIDTIKGEYNKAFFKFWIMIIFTLLLNNLCARGLGIISWTIIFMPFMLMSIVTAILLYVFGLDPTTGKLRYYTPDGQETIGVDSNRKIVTNISDEHSKFARPIDLIDHRINSVRKELETDIDNSGFTAEPTDTSSSVTTQTGKSAKSGKVTTDDSQEKTVTYKKDTSVEKESYCVNH